MRVGLIDVDGHGKFPNLALMKISAYHKAKGDEKYGSLEPKMTVAKTIR